MTGHVQEFCVLISPTNRVSILMGVEKRGMWFRSDQTVLPCHYYIIIIIIIVPEGTR